MGARPTLARLRVEDRYERHPPRRGRAIDVVPELVGTGEGAEPGEPWLRGDSLDERCLGRTALRTQARKLLVRRRLGINEPRRARRRRRGPGRPNDGQRGKEDDCQSHFPRAFPGPVSAQTRCAGWGVEVVARREVLPGVAGGDAVHEFVAPGGLDRVDRLHAPGVEPRPAVGPRRPRGRRQLLGRNRHAAPLLLLASIGSGMSMSLDGFIAGGVAEATAWASFAGRRRPFARRTRRALSPACACAPSTARSGCMTVHGPLARRLRRLCILLMMNRVGGAPTIRRAVTRAVLAVIPLSVALAACGGSDDSGPAAGGTRPEPTSQGSTSPPPSPDAGIPEGHALADARRHRCRAARPSRFWRHCARIAR